jgi:hypothetical protein
VSNLQSLLRRYDPNNDVRLGGGAEVDRVVYTIATELEQVQEQLALVTSELKATRKAVRALKGNGKKEGKKKRNRKEGKLREHSVPVWEEVDSSMLLAFRYNAGTQELSVKFNNNTIYIYFDVPPSVVVGLRTAESKGKYMRSAIMGKYHNCVWGEE